MAEEEKVNDDLGCALDAVLRRAPQSVVGVVITFVYDDGIVAQRCAATDEALVEKLDRLADAISVVTAAADMAPRDERTH